MKSKILISVLFILVLLVSVIVHIPANFAFRFLPVPLIQGLEIQGVSGTIWKGTAQQFSWQGMPLGTFNWQINLWSILAGNADLDLRLSGVEGLSASGNIGYGVNGIYANDLLLSASTAFVQSFVPSSTFVSFSGQLDLTVREFQLNEPLCDTLIGSMAWSQGNVVSPFGTVDPGLVMATLSCDKGSLVLNGDSESDALKSEFNVSLDPSQRYSIEGWLLPGDALPEGMRSQLGWLGQPDKEGRYRLSFSQ